MRELQCCWTTSNKVVESRAASHQRSTGTFGGDVPYYFNPPKEIMAIFVRVPGMPLDIEYMTAPIFPVVMALHGIMWCGFDFIDGLGALGVLTGGRRENDREASSITENNIVLTSSDKVGTSMRVGKTLGARPREGNDPETTMQEQFDKLKRKANLGSKCAVMSRYVDNCQMDGHKALCKVLWPSLRLHFESLAHVTCLSSHSVNMCSESPERYNPTRASNEWFSIGPQQCHLAL